MQITFDLLQTTAIGSAVVFLGIWLRRRVLLLERYCLPGPVVAGLLASLLFLLLRTAFGVQITWNLQMKDLFMNLFFTCVGFGASAKLLRMGGARVLAGIAISICGLVVLQNIVGIAIAVPMGMHPLNGMMCSSVATAGGVGTAAAFGPVFEGYGAPDSGVIGMAAGTFGMIFASLIGGPVARGIIQKRKLRPTDAALSEEERRQVPLSNSRLVGSWCLIFLIGGLGSYLSFALQKIPMIEMPYFIGCIFSGVIFRNLMEAAHLPFDLPEIESISDVSLDIFLALALMSIDLTRLLDSALVMMVILAAQIILIVLWAHFCHRFLFGGDYNGAVMVAGLIGTGLGAGSNAVANERAVMQQFGPSQVAWIVFPAWSVIVVDIFNPLFVSLIAPLLARWG